MRRWFLSLGLLLGLLALAACAAEEEATPAPTTSATAAGKAAWEQEWDRVLAAAKQEGKVAVMGPVGGQYRELLVDLFQKTYGITVDYLGATGSQAAPRLLTERQAGQYLWDVHIGGTTTIITDLLPAGAADPIKPAFILPEATDPKNWQDSRLDFADKAEVYDLVFSATPKVILAYNKDLLDPKELKSYKDLLTPKWKGKIGLVDPRVAGPGLATFTYFYMNPLLGESFVKGLSEQEPKITRDYREIADWTAHGTIAVAIGIDESQVKPVIEAGAPVGLIQALQEGGYVTSAFGSVVLLNKAPHPNAAKVYLNWLLGKEAQTEWSRRSGYLSRRADVPQETVPEPSRVQPGVKYDTTNYKEDVVKRKEEVAAVLGKYFK